MKTSNDEPICFYADGKIQEVQDLSSSLVEEQSQEAVKNTDEYCTTENHKVLVENDNKLYFKEVESLSVNDQLKSFLKNLKYPINSVIEIQSKDTIFPYSDIEYMTEDEFKVAKRILKASKDKPFNCVLAGEIKEDSLYEELAMPYSEDNDYPLFNFRFAIDESKMEEGYFDIYFINGDNNGLDVFSTVHGDIKVTFDDDIIVDCFVPKYKNLPNCSMFRRGCFMLNDQGDHIIVTRCRVMIYNESN